MKIDALLLILSFLLALTIVLFIVDIFPYPFGVLILAIMIAARAMTISLKGE